MAVVAAIGSTQVFHCKQVFQVLFSLHTSAKIYLAPDAQLLRQDTRHGTLAPMTPGAFYGWLPYSLGPGVSG